MQIKNRQKFLAITAGVVVFLWLSDSLLFTPLFNSWKARSEHIAELRKNIDHGKQELSHGIYYRSRWEDMRTNALPANVSRAESQLQRSFDKWERASGVTRVAFKPQWKEEDDYMTLECHAEYSGDMTKIKNFLYQIETVPQGVKVDDVEIASHDDTGQQLTLAVQVSGLMLSPPPQAEQP